MEKLRLPSKKTAKRSFVNYTKSFFRTKGMTCNDTPFKGVVSTVPFMNFVL